MEDLNIFSVLEDSYKSIFVKGVVSGLGNMCVA